LSRPSSESIEDLWHAALATPLHGTHCSCAGGAHAHALTAQELEDELLDYLIPRYAADADIGAALHARRNSRRGAFAGWLQTLPQDAAERLSRDVAQTLRSLVEGTRHA
jgi:hypothetical protein